MSASNFPGKWVSAINAAPTRAVFMFFDVLDELLCVSFRLLDECLEGKSNSCYCSKPVENKYEDPEFLSETLFRRRNFLRETNLLRFARKPELSKKMGLVRFLRKFLFPEKMKRRGSEPANRWSDCGCKNCVSWTKSDKLNVVVKQPSLQDFLMNNKPTENVILIHGFMGSSSFWTNTVLKNLSEHATSNYKFFAVDLLGFGDSPKPRNNLYTLKDHVEMIEKSVILPYGLNSFHVVAHSMGCIIGVALASKYSTIVKSVALVAPPYFANSEGEGASLGVLDVIAEKKLWPPPAFFTAVMSRYEHVGRCICFIICRHHRIWERIIKIITWKRSISPMIRDMTKHTHHSAWHSVHNVICGGAKFTDRNLGVLADSEVRIHVVQGDLDEVVPLDCIRNMKTKFPTVEVEIVAGTDHRTVITGRRKAFTAKLESLWDSIEKNQNGSLAQGNFITSS
ncbi:PREDICTED: probable lysophospholipase BODYGUARD 5 [Tarenaya hassleriana]|uniref:probable lysophospholipase BODYGUARD 5 n=1 Tax=Tarenaya hassleriana TaxID=28532 RepID=UPI00053C981A|nr:PREDICTED: probable lysophospholipase BODYGUARD 5 [Tarenaya hassleriana]